MTTAPPDRLIRSVSPAAERLGRRMFLAAVALLLILSEVFSSNIQTTLPGFSHLCRIGLTAAAAGLLLFKCLLLTPWQTRRQMAAAAAAALYAAAAAAYGGDQWFFFAVLLGLGAVGADLRQTLRVYLAFAAAGLLLVQLLHAATDYVPYLYYCRNWDYGYGHYNGYGARLAGVFFAWGWLRWPHLRARDWAGLSALAAYTLLGPGCRGAGIAMVLLLALFAVQRALPAFFEGRVWHTMAVGAAPLALGFSLWAGWRFDPENPAATPLLDRLNRLLSGRFEIWHHVFWGNALYHPEQDGVPGWYHDGLPRAVTFLGGLATDGDEHHAIDNAFLAIPMNKGVLGAMVIGTVFLVLMVRLCRHRCTGETLFLTVILVYFLMENKCFLFSADPFVLLLPAALLTPRGQPLPVVCPVSPHAGSRGAPASPAYASLLERNFPDRADAAPSL